MLNGHCLQHLQQGNGRLGCFDRFPAPGETGRHDRRDRHGDSPGRQNRLLRRAAEEPGRTGHRGLPRPLTQHEQSASRPIVIQS
jgi:hypothetical protein